MVESKRERYIRLLKSKSDLPFVEFSFDAVKEIVELLEEPERNLLKLASEIADFKKHIKSENSDYLTGYLSALSVVEGMIAEMRGVSE